GTFDGNGARDAIDFLQHYERVARSFNFTPQQFRDVFSLSLTGTAAYWFTELSQNAPGELAWNDIKDAFVETFATAKESQDQAIEYQLAQCKLKPGEPPLVYVFDMLSLIKRLSAEPLEKRKIDLIIAGLSQDYKSQIILQQPT